MFKCIACFLFSVITVIAHSQLFSLKGKITDAATGKPVAGASIFLSNTSYGSISSNAGIFEIKAIKQGRYDLIITYIGYETYSQTVSVNESKDLSNIAIKEKPAELKEVIIHTYEKDGWQKWGKFFLENFIGNSALSQSCSIKNNAAIKFSFSKKTNELNVYASEPLIIENKALGYNIIYQFESFNYNFNTKYLFYSGYPLFREMEGNTSKQRKWLNARNDAYEVSLMRFMRSLYRNRLTQDGYEIYRLQRIPNIEKQRLLAKEKMYYDTVSKKATILGYEETLKTDSLLHYKKIIAEKDPIEIIHPGLLEGPQIAYGEDSLTAVLDFKDYLIVRFPKRTIPQEYASAIGQSDRQPISSVLYLPNGTPVRVTSSGYYYNVQDLLTDGFWGWWEKIAGMLPYDFVPGATTK